MAPPAHSPTCPCTRWPGCCLLIPAGPSPVPTLAPLQGLRQGPDGRGRTLGGSPRVLGSSPSEFLAEPGCRWWGMGLGGPGGSQLCNQAALRVASPRQGVGRVEAGEQREGRAPPASSAPLRPGAWLVAQEIQEGLQESAGDRGSWRGLVQPPGLMKIRGEALRPQPELVLAPLPTPASPSVA